MGHQESGSNVYPTSFQIPDDGDQYNAASVNVAFEALADRTTYNNTRIISLNPLASLAALTAIAAPINDMVRIVERYGWYSFDAAATDTAVSPMILAADDATPGRWVRGGMHNRKVHRAFSAARGFFTMQAPNNGARAKTAAFSTDSRKVNVLGTEQDWARIESGALVMPFAPDISGGGGTFTYGYQWCLDDVLVEGATLEAVWALLDPANGRGALPATPISVGIFRSDPGSSSMVSLRNTGDFVADPAASVASYEANHALIYTPNQNNVISKIAESYYLQVWNEFGSNVLANNKVLGFYILQSNVPDLRWGNDY